MAHEITNRIDDLITEEHELRSAALGTGMTSEQQARLREIEQQLDQCWDLLRQRRALAEFDEDPGQAAPRPTRQVEDYQQ